MLISRWSTINAEANADGPGLKDMRLSAEPYFEVTQECLLYQNVHKDSFFKFVTIFTGKQNLLRNCLNFISPGNLIIGLLFNVVEKQ